jgi:hypothetical protein
MNNLKFGFESEFLFPFDRKDDYDGYRETLVSRLENYFGRKITKSNFYHGGSKRTDRFFGQIFDHIEPDGSICEREYKGVIKPTNPFGKDICWFPSEFASMTYSNTTHDNPFQAFLDGIEDFFCFLAQNRCVTNSSTGFHVTISGIPLKSTNWAQLLLNWGSENVLKSYKRNNNRYCSSNLREAFCDDSITAIIDRAVKMHKVKGPTQFLMNSLNNSLARGDKNFDLHFKSASQNLIEIRAFGGDYYHLRFKEISSHIKRFISLAKEPKPVSFNRIYREHKKAMKQSYKNDDVFFEALSDSFKSISLFSSADRKCAITYLNENLTNALLYMNRVGRNSRCDGSLKELLNKVLFPIKISLLKGDIENRESLAEIYEAFKNISQYVNDNPLVDNDRIFGIRVSTLPFDQLNIIDAAFNHLENDWYCFDSYIFGQYGGIVHRNAIKNVIRILKVSQYFMSNEKTMKYFSYHFGTFINRIFGLRQRITTMAQQILFSMIDDSYGSGANLKRMFSDTCADMQSLKDQFSEIEELVSLTNKTIDMLKGDKNLAVDKDFVQKFQISCYNYDERVKIIRGSITEIETKSITTANKLFGSPDATIFILDKIQKIFL